MLREPRSAYVGTVVGLNLYAAQGDSHGHVHTADGGLIVTTSPTEGAVWATIPPSAVSLHLHEPEGSPRNAWRLRIASVTMQGQSARVGLVGDVPLTAEVTLESVTALGLQVGQRRLGRRQGDRGAHLPPLRRPSPSGRDAHSTAPTR